MTDLKTEKCVPCEEGGPSLTEEQISEMTSLVAEWKVVEEEGIKKIKRTYTFKDFKEALYFVDRIGAEAEAQNHHPRLVLEWGKVEAWWWTHKVKGLHRNDFIMAAKTDEVYEESKQLD